MIFSKRRQLERFVKEWCFLCNAPLDPFNVITALDDLNLINTKFADELVHRLDSEDPIVQIKEYIESLHPK